MWKVTSVGKGGGLGRNGWWGCDGGELYNERIEQWREREREREERIERERGTILFLRWILLPQESLCKAWYSFILEYKSDSSI